MSLLFPNVLEIFVVKVYSFQQLNKFWQAMELIHAFLPILQVGISATDNKNKIKDKHRARELTSADFSDMFMQILHKNLTIYI
jgi:hypothetical protein